MIMLPYKWHHVFLECLIEFLANWSIMTEIRKLPIDSPNNFDIIVFDLFQILFLKYFRVKHHILIELVVYLTSCIVLPIL